MDFDLDKTKASLTDEKIDFYIQLLKKRLPRKATAYNAPFRFAHKIPFDRLSDEQKETYFRDYTAEVCKFLLLPKSIHILFVNTMKEPGKYVFFDGLHHIQIRPGLATGAVYWAVLAHEITHYYLYTHQISLPDTLSNEYLTEIAAVYLGFGFQMLDGYRAKIVEKDALNQRGESVGYVNRDTILRAIIATAKTRKQQPYHIIEQFDSENKTWARRRLHESIKEYEAFKQKREAGS